MEIGYKFERFKAISKHKDKKII